MTKLLSFLDNISRLGISYAYTQSVSSLHQLAELGQIEGWGLPYVKVGDARRKI